MRRWLIAVTAAAGVSSGCYFHHAVIDPFPAPNTSVTVTLTQRGREELSGLLGPGAHALDGRVLASSPDTIALAVYHMRRVNGRIEPWEGQHVALPQRSAARVEERRFSAPATAAVVGGAVLVLALGAEMIKHFHAR
jgi:hypothetical protein